MMRRVVKVGGSLLLRPDLGRSLSTWLLRQPPAQHALIVGGGEMIDAVRKLAMVHNLDPETVHWMCIDLLRQTEQVVAEIVDGLNRIQDRDAFTRWSKCPPHGSGNTEAANTLISIPAFYFPGCGSGLPNDWDTTSDAIAAYLGTLTRADEVVLLKSCDVPQGITVSQCIETGIIDRATAILMPRTGNLRVERLP
ncbi:hypothetical protein K227x_21210 [Rubripirellula lacrimiformis]|uniref:Amino acid kinase family protein n=1 Tax=Rubripirellula lacrimiformis TaxID=1930273 RepID=A0A517N9B8_9BACT|nr:hypothetical protein [Rubripirellula lacrimiformis]QDT03736.1 hypothetical protein K227x_21210 [Rubripirellula lacrimiformis]